MKAIILAAGRGSRMGSLTADDPKCLVRLGERRLLEIQLSALRTAGIQDIVIVTGWQGDKLRGFCTAIFENPRWSRTNMVMSLNCASSWLLATDCIVSYSDIFYTSATVKALFGAREDIAISYDPNWLALWQRRFRDPLSDAETFQIDAGDCLTEIGGRSATIDEIKGQYIGLLRFTPAGWQQVRSFLDELPEGGRDKLDMTSLLRSLIARGNSLQAIAVEGPWGEVDTASDLALYERDIKEGRLLLR